MQPGWSEHVCWTCGGVAEAACALHVDLTADPKRPPDAMGYPVRRDKRAATLHMAIPRCRACRSRDRTGAVTMVLAFAGGAAALAGSYWWTGPHAGRMPWFEVINTDVTTAVLAFLGAVLGGLITVFAAFRRPAVGRRSVEAYPPVVALTALGWVWPTAD